MIISEILKFLRQQGVEFTFSGDETQEVEGFSSLGKYRSGTFTWVKSEKNIPEDVDWNKVCFAIVQVGTPCSVPNQVVTAQSKRAFFSAIEHFYGETEDRPPIGQFTYISPEVTLGKNVRIGHNCTLDGKITIGDNTVIWNNVVLVGRVTVGKNCDIRSGAVIGHDGFAYVEDDNHKKTMVKHFGGVTIGDNVLVGENVCVHRGTIDDTVLEDGVKIDTLTHVAHNCHYHKNAVAAAPCRTNGSVIVGENAYMAGALVRNQCVIGKNAFIGLGAVVVKDVPDGVTVVGNPAKPYHKKA